MLCPRLPPFLLFERSNGTLHKKQVIKKGLDISVLSYYKQHMGSSPKKVAGQVRRVINRLIFLEKRSVFQHGMLRLYPSEIHLMQALKETPDLNAGEMAQRMGISNGAVSQTLARLERKSIIIKTKDTALKNKLTVTFTESGKAAIQGFEIKQASATNAFSGYLSGLSNNDRNVIECFLSHMEDLLKRLE